MAMKYFVIVDLLIFLGVMFYLDIIRYFIDPRYFVGLRVVPIIMLAELFSGIFFNLSLWYKLTDRTQWGVYFSLIGLVIALAAWLHKKKDLICDDFDDDLLTDEDEDAEYIAAQYMDHPVKEEAEEESEPEEQEETSSDEDDSLAPDVEL